MAIKNTGRQVNLPVTITAKPLTLDKTSITIDEKTSGYINITNGNGWYSVTRNNANVSVHPNGSTGYRVYGEKVWSSVLNIRDSAGKVVSVSVVVRELPKITSYSHTPTVEDGYVWWFYFKIDKPNLVKEAWIEYFHTNSTNIIPRATDWKKQTLKVETDWEFGAFIMPRTKVNYVRWYIVTQSGNKIYTSTNWNIIASNVSLSDYYNLWWWQMIANVWEDETSEDTEGNENIWENSESWYIEEEEWVEVNAVPLVIIWVIAVFNAWMTIYDLYTTAQTCNNEWYFTIICWIEAWLSIIPIKWWKQAKNVLEFAWNSKKFGKDVIKISRNNFTKKLSDENLIKISKSTNHNDIANLLWFNKINWQVSHWQAIYYNSKLWKYISKDIDWHNGWFWKMASSISNLWSKDKRDWTFDKFLNFINK